MMKMIWLALGVTLMLAGGCASYRLQGVVIEGASPGIEILDQKDPRLEAIGIPSAEVVVYLDPQRLSPKTIGRGTTDGEGDFTLPISEPGAGFLMLDIEVAVSRDEFQAVRQQFKLPGGGKRLLITLKRGKGGDVYDGNVLDKTLRDAEPYLKE